MRGWTTTAALFAALVLGAPRPAGAEDPPRSRPPAPAPDLAKSLASARALVDEEKWAEGEAALRKVFADFPDDAGVRAKLRDIEEQLKLCVFRKSLPPVKGSEFFGDAAKRFSPATRDVELHFATTIPSISPLRAPLWDSIEGGFNVLNVRFEGSMTIESELAYLDSERRTAVFLLCYDIEKRGGYMVTPGYRFDTRDTVWKAEARIQKVGADERTVAVNFLDEYGTDFSGPLTITRTVGDIVVKVGKTTLMRGADSSFSSGYFGVRAGGLRTLTIKGRVDKHAWRKMVGERFVKQFAAWEQSTWNREKEIPAWAREAAVAPPDMTLDELPSDAPENRVANLRATVAKLADGDQVAAAEVLRTTTKGLSRTSLYLRGLADLALGAFKSAHAGLDQLAAEEPEFVPARLFRGVAQIGLRRLVEAREDLDWALSMRSCSVDAFIGAVELAVLESDLPRAEALLAKAADTTASDERLDEVRDWVHRCAKGPQFAQRFVHETDHFVVASDHSKKVCFDTATLLESMQTRYAEAVGAAKGRVPKSRVYVFSGERGYLDYAAGLHTRADSTAGVYLPMLRELAIWIPLDMTTFTDTVRHEGFHQYVHRLVDDPPIWFNEGYASVLGGGGPEGVRNADRDGVFVKAFVPVRTLVAMRQPAFMKIAGVTYTESRYLVDFLRTTKHEKLKTVLRDYFAAVVDGLSQDEANANVLDPVMDVLETEFKRSY